MTCLVQDKVILITGASSGIGKATAMALAGQGAQVVMVGRDEQRTKQALAEIMASYPQARCQALLADLSNMQAIRKLAERFQQSQQRLSVLINNVGYIAEKREVTAEGFEKQWATNYLGPFLLTHLLLDLLKTSAPSRIINVGADLYRLGKIDFNDLQLENGYSGIRMYMQSKLALNLFTNRLAQMLAGSGVTINALHPGVVRTNFNGQAVTKYFKWFKPFLASPAQGARTTIYLATNLEVAKSSGCYFRGCRPVSQTKQALDPDLQARLWAATMSALQLAKKSER